MALTQDIEDIRAGIRAGRFVNEASVSQGIVLRVLHALGWPAYNTSVVSPEFALEGRRVDFALCHPPGKPIAFVEVKQIGQSDGAERQLFEYAFHRGVPLAILTDGQEWNFFLPGEQGDYGERRVYKLDIVERDVGESVHRLERYLLHSAVASGEAIREARKDYQDVAKERQIQLALPTAWERLVAEEDELLLEVVADKVESICGFKPDPDTAAAFLKGIGGHVSSSIGTRKQSRLPEVPLPKREKQAERGHAEAKLGAPLPPEHTVGFSINGTFHSGRNAKHVMLQIIEALSARDTSFQERFAALPTHGRSRRYVSQDRNELYPGRPDLCREHATRLQSGWWVSTNHSKATIRRIIEMACEVAGLRTGVDVVAHLGL